MNMTHYMGLLAQNQPWNLILFMVIPVVLAETVAITELFILLTRQQTGTAPILNKLASILGGTYFLGVFGYLMWTAVAPLTSTGGWRGPADLLAVGFYLSGVIPLGMLALIDTRIVGKQWEFETKLRHHAFWVAVFLVVAHIAMVFGMLDPTVMGWAGEQGGHHSH